MKLYYELTEADVPEARSLLRDGIDVACLEADPNALAAVGGPVHRIGLMELQGDGVLIQHELVVAVTELAIQALQEQTPLAAWLARLHGSEDFRNYFGRLLVHDIDALLILAFVVARDLAEYESITLAPDWPQLAHWTVVLDLLGTPEFDTGLRDLLPPTLLQALRSLRIAPQQRSEVGGALRRTAARVISAARIWRLMRKLSLRPQRQAPLGLLIRTYANDWGISLGGYKRLRDVDFIVNGAELAAEDVAFWIEPGVSEQHREGLRRRGYRLFSDDGVRIGLFSFAIHVLPVLVSSIARLPALFRANAFWRSQVTMLVYRYVVWDAFCRTTRPAVFLAYNDLDAVSVARNLVLRKHGCFSVAYQHSSGGGYSSIDGGWSNLAYSFAVLDAVAIWGPAHEELFRRHPNAIRELWNVGCLWSEHVRVIEENGELRSRYGAALAERVGGPLDRFERAVSFFDGTIEREGLRIAWVGFLAGVRRLASAMPNVLFLVKPKYPLEDVLQLAGEEGRTVIRQLEVLDNVVVLPNRFETAAVLALSDCAIAIPFSSVAIEALGAGKPGFYYGHHESLDLQPRVAEGFPGIVCRSEEELEARVRDLLWGDDRSEDLDRLLERVAILEGHFDGLAITRLRRRLLAEIKRRQSR